MEWRLLHSMPMKTLAAVRGSDAMCVICGELRTVGETWFLITENRWEDRLNVWSYGGGQTRASGYSLCSPKHVRELVVHWMTTGCLQYPFATNPHAEAKEQSDFALLNEGKAHGPEISRSRLCEIAVDREGIVRALRDAPLSLNTILDEMMIVLEGEIADETEEDFESGECFAVSGLE